MLGFVGCWVGEKIVRNEKSRRISKTILIFIFVCLVREKMGKRKDQINIITEMTAPSLVI